MENIFNTLPLIPSPQGRGYIFNFNALQSCRRALHWGKKGRREFFCLFSGKGFTEAMIKVVKKKRVCFLKKICL